MRLSFTKMHGTGNDFMVVDATQQAFDLNAEQIKQLSDRHFGIGFDQLLVVETAQDPANDFRYRIYNADGGEVEQCGNGVRCFARFVNEQGLSDKQTLRVETCSGVVEPQLNDDGLVRVDMGLPRFAPSDIPFLAEQAQDRYALAVEGKAYEISALSVGNPHAVLFVDDVDKAPVSHLGPLIEQHHRFPNRVNAGFAQLLNRQHIKLRVWERGVGETLACGTGACAAVVAGQQLGILDEQVTVDLSGGQLQIARALGNRGTNNKGMAASNSAPVMMSGPAVTVFSGEIEL